MLQSSEYALSTMHSLGLPCDFLFIFGCPCILHISLVGQKHNIETARFFFCLFVFLISCELINLKDLCIAEGKVSEVKLHILVHCITKQAAVPWTTSLCFFHILSS